MQSKVLLGTTEGLYEIDGAQLGFGGREVQAIAHEGSHVWTIINNRELWQSGSSGVETKVATLETGNARCLLSASSGLLVGTSEAHLFVLHGDMLVPIRSFDTAPGRETWHTPWGAPPDVRSMAADSSGRLYVNVHVGGIVRSIDNGKSWTPTIDVHADVHEVYVDHTSKLLLAATARGLAVSTDGGGSWRFETDGLHGHYARAVTIAGGTILLTASTGPSSKRAAVYRKQVESNAPFERCREGLPEWFSRNIDTRCMAASGARAVFGTSTGDVFLSEDEGRSWRMVAQGLPPVRCVSLI